MMDNKKFTPKPYDVAEREIIKIYRRFFENWERGGVANEKSNMHDR